MIVLKTKRELELMREAGHISAVALKLAGQVTVALQETVKTNIATRRSIAIVLFIILPPFLCRERNKYIQKRTFSLSLQTRCNLQHNASNFSGLSSILFQKSHRKTCLLRLYAYCNVKFRICQGVFSIFSKFSIFFRSVSPQKSAVYGPQ